MTDEVIPWILKELREGRTPKYHPFAKALEQQNASWKHAVTAGRIRCAKDLAHGSVHERMELLPLTSIVVR